MGWVAGLVGRGGVVRGEAVLGEAIGASEQVAGAGAGAGAGDAVEVGCWDEG